MAESDTRSWSELLPDLLSVISNKILDPVELLAFRATCRSWLLASSNAADNLKESLLHQIPWLLCQESGNKEECVVHNFTTKGKYNNIKLPELVRTIILGSFQGWLLLFKTELGRGQIFFFCPFSRQKISLPDLPESKICYNSMAVCNSSPASTSDRTICVFMQEDIWSLVIYILRPLSQTWDEVMYSFNNFQMKDIVGAMLEDEKLILFNHNDEKELMMINIVENNESKTIIKRVVLIHFNDVVADNYSSNERKLLSRAFEAMESCLESNDIVKKSISMDDLACAYFYGTKWNDSNGKELMLFNESYIVESLGGNELMMLFWLDDFNMEEYIMEEYIDKKFNEPIPTLDLMHLKRGIWFHPRLFWH